VLVVTVAATTTLGNVSLGGEEGPELGFAARLEEFRWRRKIREMAMNGKGLLWVVAAVLALGNY
jgi:hypothetical protein